MSEFKDNKWGELKRLSDNINDSKFNVPSVSITHDGNTMFFVATKRDGMGGKDIYKSTKGSNGEWSDPELLGPEINTEEDEDAPFLSNDGKSLYFSSKGHKGVGGYDVYKSEFQNGKLTPAVNLGLPLNSPFDDIYLVIDEKDEIGFFSSNRNGGFGAMDIFGFDLSCPNIENTELRGIVYNKTEKQPIQAKITLADIESGQTSAETNTIGSNGKFLLIAPPERSYKLSIEALGYEKQTIQLDIPKQCEFYPLFSEISLENIEQNGENYQIATLRNSYFNRDDVLNDKIDTTNISKEVPLVKEGNDKDYDNDKTLIALTRTIDTSSTELAYIILSDTVKVEKIIVDTSTIEYKEFFAYNIKDVDVNSPSYKSVVEKAIAKVKAFGKVELTITSSASRVPTTTYKTNINLASKRGDEAKAIVMKSLVDKGISEDQVIVKGINSIISGPRYTGDFENLEKYKDFQYVKISIK
jgi:hypothetical protein